MRYAPSAHPFATVTTEFCIYTESNVKEIITLVINDKSESGKYIIVPISEYNNKNRGIFINQLDSIYGKDTLCTYLKNHNIIAYNNKKMNELMSELSLQLGMCDIENSFTYEDSITNSFNDVKTVDNKLLSKQEIFNKYKGDFLNKEDSRIKEFII